MTEKRHPDRARPRVLGRIWALDSEHASSAITDMNLWCRGYTVFAATREDAQGYNPLTADTLLYRQGRGFAWSVSPIDDIPERAPAPG